MSWLLNTMDYEDPDNLSDALLVSDGSPRDEILAPPVATFDRLLLPTGILDTPNNSNNHDNRFNFGRFLETAATANGNPGEQQHSINVINNQQADCPSRCRILCTRMAAWVYLAAIMIGVLDKLLDLHLLPESTIPVLFGGLLVLILSATLYVVMPTIVTFCEIVQHERSLHAGTPR